MRDRIIGLGILGVTFGLGVVAGHILTKRHLEAEYRAEVEKEVVSIRKHYAKRTKRDEYASPEAIVTERYPESLSEQKTGPGGISFRFRSPEDEEAYTKANDFGNKVKEFDYRRETAQRTPEIPYVISWDEFNENAGDYDQKTLIYFSKDDVLVEEHDNPIEDVLDLLGPVALDQFGNGSNDPNIVYVRNERISMDFEVCYDPDSFEETVVGHIKHGDNRKIRKFRLDDD